MPQSDGGTYDDTIMVIGLSNWTSRVKKHYYFTCSNRNGDDNYPAFDAHVTCDGDDSIGGYVQAFYDTDNKTRLYIVSPPGFQEHSVTYLKTHQTLPVQTLFPLGGYDSPTTVVPTGAVVYDSRVTKPNLFIDRNGIGVPVLLQETNPQNFMTWNPLTGRFMTAAVDNLSPVSPEDAFGFGASYSLELLYYFGTHYVQQPKPTPKQPNIIITVDYNDCDKISGWIIDTNNPTVPQPLYIYFGGVKVASISPTLKRTDVAQVYHVDPNSLYGFEWLVPNEYKQGISYITSVVAVNQPTVQAGFAQNPQRPVCGVQPTYVVQRVVDGPGSIIELTGAKTYTVHENLSDGTSRPFTGAATIAITGDSSNLLLTPTDGGSKATVFVGDIGASRTVNIVFTFQDNTSASREIKLIDATCYRPGYQLKTKAQYNYIQKSTGQAKLFATLEEACTIMGKAFNEANVDITLPEPFNAEMADFNVGTDVYLRWSTETNDCQKVDNGIIYLRSYDGADGIKTAIYVVNGKIAAVLVSTYAPPATPPLPFLQPLRRFFSGVT